MINKPAYRLYYREYYCKPEYCEYDDELHYFEENYVFLTKWISTDYVSSNAYDLDLIESIERRKHRSADIHGVRWGRHYDAGPNDEDFIKNINDKI